MEQNILTPTLQRAPGAIQRHTFIRFRMPQDAPIPYQATSELKPCHRTRYTCFESHVWEVLTEDKPERFHKSCPLCGLGVMGIDFATGKTTHELPHITEPVKIVGVWGAE